MRKLDLQATLGRCCPLSEYLEDQSGPIDDLSFEAVFEIALLNRRESAIYDDEVGLVLFAGSCDVIDLAGTEQRTRPNLPHRDYRRIDDDNADCLGKTAGFLEPRFRLEVVVLSAYVRTHDESARAARYLAHQVIVETQSPSPSNSPDRSTAVAG